MRVSINYRGEPPPSMFRPSGEITSSCTLLVPPFSLPLSVSQPFCPGSRPRRSAGGFPAIGYLSSRHHLPSINPRGRRYPTAPPLSLLSIFLPSSPNPSSPRIEFALPLPKLHYSIFIPIIAVIGINVNGGKYLIIPLVYTTRHLAQALILLERTR